MKKLLACLLSLCLLSALLLPSALAAPSRDFSVETQLSAKLHSLGLWQGVGQTADGRIDFDLARAPTRVEALVMLLRTLGKDTLAKDSPKSHPFTDVPAWADGYVSYAFANGLSNGVSQTKFGAQDIASGAMYLTFLLRALGYEEGASGDFLWNSPWALASYCGILPVEIDRYNFLRADAVLATVASLYAERKNSKLSLSETLLEDGALRKEALTAAFPTQPLARSRAIEKAVATVVGERLLDGTVSAPPYPAAPEAYAMSSHVIAEMAEANGILQLTVIVCEGKSQIPENGSLPLFYNESSAPWRISLDATSLQVLSSQAAWEFQSEGITKEQAFSKQALLFWDSARSGLSMVRNLRVANDFAEGRIPRPTELTYERVLADSIAALTSVELRLESPDWTAILGPANDARSPYLLYIVHKEGSSWGEASLTEIRSGSLGRLTASKDGLMIYYDYDFTNGQVYRGTPHPSMEPDEGVCHYEIDLIKGSVSSSISK